MSDKSTVLFENDRHRVIAFNGLVKGKGIQANQFVIRNGDTEILLDPGGDLLYAPLVIELSKLGPVEDLDYVFASHQDPDIIASMDRWLMKTRAKVICSKLWSRFLPHLVPAYMDGQMGVDLEKRIMAIEDEGAKLPFGETQLLILPAHFLHSVGNLQIYDPISKILFSGDMGASMVDGCFEKDIENFEEHIPSMEGFHRRYICSQKASQLWANMVRELDVEMIVPQHGKPFKGKAMVESFLHWIENLPCGVDLLTQNNYRPPS